VAAPSVFNDLFKGYVPVDRVIAESVPVFARFEAEFTEGETYGDFCHRVGVEELAGILAPA
jgi:sulfite reductase (ferredoxin)